MMKPTRLTACIATLAILLASAGIPSANAENLGDVLREHGWDRVIGTWVDADTGGEAIRITYAWRFEGTVVEITTWSQREETVAIMGLNAKTEDVYHMGATSTGSSSLGKWEIVDGDAVLGLRYVSGEGQEGGLRIRHHLEDDDTMAVTFEGPEPTTFRLVRVGTAEPATVEARFNQLGITDETLDRIRAVLGNTGIQGEQVEQALDGMLRIIDEVRAEGADFELDPQLREHLKQEVGLTDEQVERVQGLARRVAGNVQPRGEGAGVQREGRGKKEGVFTEGATLVYVETPIRNFDTNKNVTIEESELEQGFLGILEQFEECHGMLLKLFDENKDGGLSETEGQAVREFVFGLAGALLYDANRDWKVDDSETDEAWGKLADQCERHNSGVTKRFDANHDGVLSEEEAKTARERTRGR